MLGKGEMEPHPPVADRCRAVFMGSDGFSLPILDALIAAGPGLPIPVDTVAAVTQPDRPAGRGRRPGSNPVKRRAVTAGLIVLQPERLRDPDSLVSIVDLKPDLIVVAAYGQLLPRALLAAAPAGCLNLHPSILPRFRGPSPIAGTILEGDGMTGVTLMNMSAKMDAGPIIAQVETEVFPTETAGELEARLAVLSAQLLLRTLPAWLTGALPGVSQVEALATYTGLISRDQARLDWSRPAEDLARRVRAYNPWPMAHTSWQDRTVRILRARPEHGEAGAGKVADLRDSELLVGCGQGFLAVQELQLAGGRPLAPAELVRGHPGLISAHFV